MQHSLQRFVLHFLAALLSYLSAASAGILQRKTPSSTLTPGLASAELGASGSLQKKGREDFAIEARGILVSFSVGGSWHAALPKLHKLSDDESTDRYLNLNLAELQDNAEKVGRGRQERRERHQGQKEATWDRRRRYFQGEQPERELRSGQPQERRRVWRQPIQSVSPPPSVASSSTSQLPAQETELEPVVDVAPDDADGYESHDSKIAVLDSYGAGADICGLRSVLHGVKGGD